MKDESPPNFPPMTLTTMRALCGLTLVDGQDQSRLVKALDVLFGEYWVKHRPTHQPEVLGSVLQQALGREDAEKGRSPGVLRRAGRLLRVPELTGAVMASVGTEGKRILAENTEKAFTAGSFGLPWMLCTRSGGQTEGFWGVDHLGQVVEFLGLRKPERTPSVAGQSTRRDAYHGVGSLRSIVNQPFHWQRACYRNL